MMPAATTAGRGAAVNRPTYQWEVSRGGGVLTLRLYGELRGRELARVIEAVFERGRSPRDLVCIDFEQVDHLDYRALSEFTAAIQCQRDRGAPIRFLGLGPYLRALFQVAGQGPALARLEGRATEDAGPAFFAGTAAGFDGGAARTNAWSTTRV